jgi:hypothetical protein
MLLLLDTLSLNQANVTPANEINNPKILVIDCFERPIVEINNDDKYDVPHGEIVSKILEENLPNADIYKRNIPFTFTEAFQSTFKLTSESKFCHNLDTLFAGILNRAEKYDAINMSLGAGVSYKTLSKLLGFKITSDNVANLKDRVRDSLTTSKYIVNGDYLPIIADILNKMDSIVAKGNKIYVSAGNHGKESLNLYTLADGIEVVGSCDEFDIPKEYSENNSLVTRYEFDEYPIEATRDGFDITMDGKTDFTHKQMAFPWFATKEPRSQCLEGTSFAAPNAIIKDIQENQK